MVEALWYHPACWVVSWLRSLLVLFGANLQTCACRVLIAPPCHQAALVADVPQEFVADMASIHPGSARIPPGAKVFDVFRMWRLDSGSYEDMAEVDSCRLPLHLVPTAFSQLPSRSYLRMCFVALVCLA